jgi:glutamine---fructose-6-phosphate transaminase (isomerizing)
MIDSFVCERFFSIVGGVLSFRPPLSLRFSLSHPPLSHTKKTTTNKQMKEVALIHSEGILAGEMKHGPLALVDETLPVVVVATRDAVYAKMQSVIQQLLARGARLVVLCNEGDAAMRALAQERAGKDDLRLVEVPLTADALQPVVNIVPLQLLAYHLTVLRGLNVDQPRNLAKSVTVAD